MRGEINTSSLELCFFRIKSSVIRNLFGIDLDLELTFIFSGFNSSGATSFDVIVSLWISSLIWSTWPLMLPSATRTLKVFDNLFNYEPSLLFHIWLTLQSVSCYLVMLFLRSPYSRWWKRWFLILERLPKRQENVSRNVCLSSYPSLQGKTIIYFSA